jgi:comEA protein
MGARRRFVVCEVHRHAKSSHCPQGGPAGPRRPARVPSVRLMSDPLSRTSRPPRPLTAGVGRHRHGAGLATRTAGTSFGHARAALADRLPDGLRLARVSPGRRAVFGALAMVLVVGAILGVRLAMATAAARPIVVPAADQPGASDGSASTAGAATSSPAAAAVAGAAATGTAAPGSTGSGGPGGIALDQLLLVQVAGRVRHPGVFRLAAGTRVQDALRAAGGALPGSDLVGINLAQPLTDGEQVVVARAGRGSTVSTGGGSGAGAAAAGPSGGAMVNLNAADVTGLDALPGVGPVLAQRILDWRLAHGRFTSVDELDEVSGIGDKLMAEIRPHVRL